MQQTIRDHVAGMTQGARRRLTAGQALEAAPSDIDDLRHIHSVLAMCGLPYTRQGVDVREYERRQGRMSLVVEAGKLRNPSTGEREAQPLTALATQFGGDFSRARDFRRGFADDMAHLKDVFPKLPVRLSEEGLLIQPAGPDVLALPVKSIARKR